MAWMVSSKRGNETFWRKNLLGGEKSQNMREGREGGERSDGKLELLECSFMFLFDFSYFFCLFILFFFVEFLK